MALYLLHAGMMTFISRILYKICTMIRGTESGADWDRKWNSLDRKGNRLGQDRKGNG